MNKEQTELEEIVERVSKETNIAYDEYSEEYTDILRKALTSYADKRVQEGITENTSDGYHTFKELYEFRKIYNALAFNEWYEQGKYLVHKSKKHSDGELCFGGSWFIVVATLPTGQISNHYELKDWNLFKCEEREIPNAFDGHTAEDVRERIVKLIDKCYPKYTHFDCTSSDCSECKEYKVADEALSKLLALTNKEEAESRLSELKEIK